MKLTFEKYTLSNGITLIVKENHHAQSVVVRGHLPGGANLDPPQKAGLASLAAGAMRRGTKKRTYRQINQAVEAVAGSVYLNAGRHLLSFGGKSLAEDFSLLVELMTDNLLQPTFPPTEIEKLRGQVITDLKELEDDPYGLARRSFRELLYSPHHPYGRPIDGTLESVPQLSRDDLLGYYHRLHPQDGVVVVVGHVTGQAVYDALEAALGRWQPDHAPPQATLPTPPPLTDRVRSVQALPDKSQADVVLGFQGPSRLSDDFYPAYVGNTILGQLGLGGRIGLSVRDRAGMAYYASSSLQAGLGPGSWYLYAGVNPLVVEQAIELMLAEVERLRTEPVDEEELADAKSYLTGVLPLQMEANEGVAAVLLRMELYGLGDDYIERYPEIIGAITGQDILAAAQKYFSVERYALAIAGPQQP